MVIRGNTNLVQPVRIQHAESAAAASSTLLRDGAEVASEFQLLHTLVHGLAIADTLLDSRGERKEGKRRGRAAERITSDFHTRRSEIRYTFNPKTCALAATVFFFL